MFNCENCNKEFKHEKRLLTHTSSCEYKDILYTCQKCLFMTYNFHEISNHKEKCDGTNIKNLIKFFGKKLNLNKKIKKKPQSRLSFLENNKEQDFVIHLKQLLESSNDIKLNKIERRILQHTNYYEDFLEPDEIEEYKSYLLKCDSKFEKNYDNFIPVIFCYGLSLFSVENILTFFIGEKTKNFISYMEDNNKYPYRFYYFSKIVKKQNKWTMDCRLESFSESLTTNLRDYMIKLFRKNYHAVFGDNNFRSFDVMKNSDSQLINLDCIQLLSNLIKISSTVKIQQFLQELIMKTSQINKDDNNNFNLTMDDRVQLQKFKEKLKYNYDDEKIRTIEMLFDDSDDKDMKMILNEFNFS